MPAEDPPLLKAVQLAQAGRTDEAVLLVKRLAAGDDTGALYMLAELNFRGGLVPQNVPEGRELFGRAGERGHLIGACYYTNLLASGIAGPRDWRQALARLRFEADYDPARRETLQLLQKMKLTPNGDPQVLPQARALSAAPEVTLYPGAFTRAECDYLLKVAGEDYKRTVVYGAGGQLIEDPIRTSEGSTVHWLIEDPAVHAINRRLAALSGSKAEAGEPMQILRYRPGQQYRPHTDFVGDDNQRILTGLIYLNEDYAGGETSFPKLGVHVKGRIGDALIFRSATAERRNDLRSEHAGLAVTSGTKFIASRWIRERRWVP